MKEGSPESLFGSIRQVAYVVRGLDRAIAGWHEQLGVGPFAVARGVTPLTGSRYRGEASGEIVLDLAFAYIGDIQLELIEQLDDTPSMYREALANGVRGLHHYGFCVEDFAAAYRHALANGFDAIVDAGIPGVAQMSYVESRRIPGLICELIEWNDLTRPYFDGIERFLASADPAQLVHELDLGALAAGTAA